MSKSAASSANTFKRVLSNLAAIIAVTTIFGVKALEIERHSASADKQEPGVVAQASLKTGR
ncbi:hypothetical protein PUV54_08420 [Hyphococcus flavus]|uniref:Uncharacterized protein n=1 Tax=Hyphococcus flavus TaxID=1866326 RepID=A0AAE9ZDV5_9PROT|nr:hypothetical protein [Hyphococcus flavus]WDI33219.1 hypothetical protein PUV54_08420 [Hyphococcus flavus]